MASQQSKNPSSFAPGHPAIVIHVRGQAFRMNKRNLLGRSGKLSNMAKEKAMHRQQFITCFLPDIPGDPKTLRMALDFCDGGAPHLTPSNVVPLACTASYLEMTDAHSPNNLFDLCITFLRRIVLPHWTTSLQSLQSCQEVLSHASSLGLVSACVDAVAAMAAANPYLLIHHATKLDHHGSKARKKLFHNSDHAAQDGIDLVDLGLPLFDQTISAMLQLGLPSEYASDCLFRYTAKYPSKEVMEAVEKRFPHVCGVTNEGGFAPHCKMLSEMLRRAVQVQACRECREGLEARMARHLHLAAVEDLLIPSHGYSKETQYDVECVVRMLKDFYGNYSLPDSSGFVHALHLVTAYLSHVAGDPCLRIETFMSLVGIVAFTLAELGDCTDTVYGAIDLYLSAHGHLTESEKEHVCRLLVVHHMSSSALGHAAQNERLPLRLLVQVLFVFQFRMQETINPAMDNCSTYNPAKLVSQESQGLAGEIGMSAAMLEQDGGESGSGSVQGKKMGSGRRKASLWKNLKRKFGCKSGSLEMEDESKYYRIKKPKFTIN